MNEPAKHITTLPSRKILYLAAVLVGFAVHAPLAYAQATVDARADLTPRVIRRDEGEKRFFPDGRFMVLKVGPVIGSLLWLKLALMSKWSDG